MRLGDSLRGIWGCGSIRPRLFLARYFERDAVVFIGGLTFLLTGLLLVPGIDGLAAGAGYCRKAARWTVLCLCVASCAYSVGANCAILGCGFSLSCCVIVPLHFRCARVAELADAVDSKSTGGNIVRVRVSPRAPYAQQMVPAVEPFLFRAELARARGALRNRAGGAISAERGEGAVRPKPGDLRKQIPFESRLGHHTFSKWFQRWNHFF